MNDIRRTQPFVLLIRTRTFSEITFIYFCSQLNLIKSIKLVGCIWGTEWVDGVTESNLPNEFVRIAGTRRDDKEQTLLEVKKMGSCGELMSWRGIVHKCWLTKILIHWVELNTGCAQKFPGKENQASVIYLVSDSLGTFAYTPNKFHFSLFFWSFFLLFFFFLFLLHRLNIYLFESECRISANIDLIKLVSSSCLLFSQHFYHCILKLPSSVCRNYSKVQSIKRHLQNLTDEAWQ